MSGAKKSPFAVRMDEIQSRIDPHLKQLGFRKSGRTYNRETDPGIVQVINFQMGAYEPPIAGVPPVPSWLKPDLYGKFAVNLGIFVEEIARSYKGYKKPKFVSEPSCAIRLRLGRLINQEGKEYWWNLGALAETIVLEVKPILLSAGVDFLNRFASRSAIIADFVQFNDRQIACSSRPRLDVGIMLAARGDMIGANRLFREHLALPKINPSHEAYVKELAAQLGIKLEN